MKVAYIAPFADGTGYGKSANLMVECLDSVGIDVVPVWITLSNNLKGMHKKVAELSKGNLKGVDCIIQHSLPEHFVKHADIPCIGTFFYECNHFKGSNWQSHLNLMDRVWCFTPEQVEASIKSGVDSDKVVEINQPFDFTIYKQKYPKLDFGGLDHRYKFYYIGEISQRKNVAGVIQAYLTEFTARDNVCLIIKGFIDGLLPAQSEKHFEDNIKGIKNELKLTNKATPPVLFISEYLTEEQIMRLHTTCDCFVTAARAESICIPLVDAVALGNDAVAPNWNGPKKILKQFPQYVVNSLIEKPLFGMQNAYPNIYNTDECWYEPSGAEICKLMRFHYKNSTAEQKTIGQLYSPAQKLMSKFSYEVVGQQLKKEIESLL